MKHFRMSCGHFPVQGGGNNHNNLKGTSSPLVLQQILIRKHQPQIKLWLT